MQGTFMRKLTVGVGISLVVCLVGCNMVPWRRTDTGDHTVDNSSARLSSESLVRYLNGNAQQIDSLRSPNILLDVRAEQSVGLNASLSCMRPRYFRLRASGPGGGLEADFGSNEEEFWYFIKRDNPPNVYYCPYDAMKEGNVRLPLPFQPEMILAALGMATYDPAGQYEVKQSGGKIELIENTVSPQGQPMQHVVRFDARSDNQLGSKPRVIGHIIRDKNGKEIFTATILSVEKKHGPDGRPVAEVPTHFEIAWPAQKMGLTMRLYDVKLNSIDRNNPGQLFAWRDSLKGYQSAVNLAQLGTGTPTGIQRTGGIEPIKIR
jgi:hypothetical protein